ncbi:uncharacterized protein LOC103579904 [Microplitis demolitor]|uniref:uncharacterized protein LOC103579904 n=1 Tax=Microplitis demolitor TaxID=69319 RepID=UPI00235B5C81|nr:uncharacterized protein LOC103579904 [Microplitis demolitor]
MYAAAGGTSIANRRKQNQLNKQRPLLATNGPKIPRCRNGFEREQRISNSIKGHKSSRQHIPILQPPHHPAPSSTCHNSSQTKNRFQNPNCHSFKHQRPISEIVIPHGPLAPPLSPIQFSISPPPLSLESANSGTHPLKFNNFPFPPSSLFELRILPSTSELQFGGQGQGKVAWQSCSQPSPLFLPSPPPHDSKEEGYKTKQCEAHRRWMKRNRIRDASNCYGSSGEDDENDNLSGYVHPEINAALNTVLYVGLGTTALGLVISFIGTGEKGFLSPELRLIGPSLLCAGLLCCLLRVLLCICLCHCCKNCQWKACPVVIVGKDTLKKENTGSPSKREQPTTSLLPQCSNQIIKTSSMAVKIAHPSSYSICSEAGKGHELLLLPSQLLE